MTEQSYVIGIDLGGTKIYSAVTDQKGKIIGSAKKKTKSEKGFESVVKRIAKCVFDAADQAGIDFKTQVAGIGIGSPGPLDMDKGIVIETPNLKWKNAPLKERLESLTGKPVKVENDANAGLLGEWAFGEAKKAKHVVGLFIGTGVGGGIIIDGKPLHGFNQNAGELGHMIMDPNGPLCGCGNHGCLEAFASRTAIEHVIRQSEIKGVKTKIFKGEDRDERIRSGRLAKAFKDQDPATVMAVHQSAIYVGYAVASLVNIFNPEYVVLGGGVVEALGRPYVDIVEKVARQNVFDIALRNIHIVEAKLGDDAAALGASTLAWQDLK